MREVDPTQALQKPDLAPGGWLHFDVSFGCAGNMLVASLLDLGLPVERLRESLREAGLGILEARVQADQRSGVGGLYVDFVDETGHPIDGPPFTEPPRSKIVSTRGRRHPAPHLARPAKSDPQILGTEGLQVAPIPNATGPVASPAQHAAPPMQGKNDSETVPAAAAKDMSPTDLVSSWLQLAEVPAADVMAFLRKSRLHAIPKALAQKALRRAFHALAQVKRVADDDLMLDGRGAVDMLADIVSFACLLEYLSPARVTSSIVGISNAPVRIAQAQLPGPSPWVLGALEGLPAREMDADFETTTPTGAVLLWSVAHRSGPRGEMLVGHTGVGLGTHNPRTHANICRAMYGPAPAVPTMTGQARAQDACRLIAMLGADADVPALERELLRFGASSISWSSRQVSGGAAALEFTCAVPTEQVEDATEALYAIGCADEVVRVPALSTAPAQNVVTVQIGAAKRKPAVRIVERIFRSGHCAGQPMEADVRKAAQLMEISVAQARSMAWSEWSKQSDNPSRQRYDGDEVMK